MEPLLGGVDLRFHFFTEPTGNFRTHNGKRQMELRKPDDGGIHWVIVGGESGAHARPMHPDWVAALRDQCQSAGVAFMFKQWGEWAPAEAISDEVNRKLAEVWIRKDGSVIEGGEVDFFGGDAVLYRAGKKDAGRLLDGRTWDGVPA